MKSYAYQIVPGPGMYGSASSVRPVRRTNRPLQQVCAMARRLMEQYRQGMRPYGSSGYYLLQGGPGNAAAYYPGMGRTREEARARSLYWRNQLPWVRTAPLSRVPDYALLDAEYASARNGYRPPTHSPWCKCTLCTMAEANASPGASPVELED